MPAITGFTSVFVWEVYFKEEPVAFCLAQQGREDEAKRLLARVYKKDVSGDSVAHENAL